MIANNEQQSTELFTTAPMPPFRCLCECLQSAHSLTGRSEDLQRLMKLVASFSCQMLQIFVKTVSMVFNFIQFHYHDG